LVIKAEFYFGVKFGWIFLVMGICGTIAALVLENIILSSICGVFAFCKLADVKIVL
jgi:hypothetical protein